MDDIWFQALVVILACMNALLLLLAIVLVVKLIQISKQVKKIVDQAEEAVDKAGQAASLFEKTATPVAVFKLLANISESVHNAADKFTRKKK